MIEPLAREYIKGLKVSRTEKRINDGQSFRFRRRICKYSFQRLLDGVVPEWVVRRWLWWVQWRRLPIWFKEQCARIPPTQRWGTVSVISWSYSYSTINLQSTPHAFAFFVGSGNSSLHHRLYKNISFFSSPFLSLAYKIIVDFLLLFFKVFVKNSPINKYHPDRAITGVKWGWSDNPLISIIQVWLSDIISIADNLLDLKVNQMDIK